MSGGKGGSTTSQVQIPKYIEDAAKTNLARADYVASLGHKPYYGPDVAAQTPLTQAALGNLGSAALSYGLGTASPTAGMPQAQDFGGVMGYSSGGIYDQAVNELANRAPGQYEAIRNMFIDQQTGAAPVLSFAPAVEEQMANGGIYNSPVYTGRAGDSDYEQQQREQAQQDWQDKYGNSSGWDPVGSFVDRISPGFSSKDW